MNEKSLRKISCATCSAQRAHALQMKITFTFHTRQRFFAIVLLSLAAASTNAQITNFTLSGTSYTQNFDGMTTSATSTLPTGWGFFAGGNPANPTTATTATTQDAGTTGTGAISSSSAGGNYLFVNGVLATGTDKAVGILNSGSFSSPRAILFGFTNNTGSTITSLTLNWNYEKYRSGTRQWDWTTGFSTNGGTSYTATAAGGQTYLADANNTTVSNPPTQISKTLTINSLSLASGASLDLEWVLTGLAGSTNGQALGIDDFALSATLAAVPEPRSWIAGALALIAISWLQRQRVRQFIKL
jgi:hypothetical protein